MKYSFCFLPLFFVLPLDEMQRIQDIAFMQGEFVMESLEVDGFQVPQNKLEGTTLRIKNDQYEVIRKKAKQTVALKLYPGRRPREVDMIFPDGPNLPRVITGIYKIEGDILTICRSQAEGEKPRDFLTRPDSGYFMVGWKKVR